MPAGRVFHIQKFSLHDGGGIRTTVFLKGCPLSCWWCHNPESQSPSPERIFRPTRCMRCGQCVAACQRGALRMSENGPRVDPDRCVTDGACAMVCPTGATELLGREMGVDEVMAVIRRDHVFFEDSGGGATISGGEPLQQPQFVEALLRACRADGIHTTLDTCGYGPPDALQRLACLSDAVLYDIKHMDACRHRRYTGVSNRTILENAIQLAALSAEMGSPELTIRMPLIAGVNDDYGAVSAVADFVASLASRPPLDLLPYQWIGESKYERLGMDFRLGEARPPAPEALARIVAVFRDAGLRVTVRGEEPCQ